MDFSAGKFERLYAARILVEQVAQVRCGGDLNARELLEGVGGPAHVHGPVAEDEARFGVNSMIPSGWHRALAIFGS